MLTEFADTAAATRDANAQERMLSLGMRMPYTVMFADMAGNYHNQARSRYMRMWDALPFTPDEFVSALSRDVVGGRDDLVIWDLTLKALEEQGVVKQLFLESKFVPARYKDDKPSYSPYLHCDQVYDLQTGECLRGDVRTNGLHEPGVGRKAVRNNLELGQRLGCPNVHIEATRVGCLLWLKGDAFDVKSVNPKYLQNVRERWAEIEPHIADEVDKAAIEAAIENADLKALAGCARDMWMPLTRTRAGVHAHTELQDGENGIPLNRYLLFDNMIECWEGTSDMNDPHKRAELAKLLGEWSGDQPQAATVQGVPASKAYSGPQDPHA
ncbi:MAG: hypothetical protein JKY71_04340 [Alphaproteobacteria bacterium]|nr:hypothetical protein [Alphaproteobacteria bacterium]